jgi:hypothetical protein
MTEGRFTEADLAPSDEERRAHFKFKIEKGATAVAVIAIGLWMGGLVALGACAAPFVFKLTPAPFSGDAMGAAFARFDSIALGAAVVALGAEVLRTWAAGRRGGHPARVRRFLAILLAAGAAYIALGLTPQIIQMHQKGITRGDVVLDDVHHRAEMIGKVELFGGLARMILHVATLGSRVEDEDDDAPGPLPPGPRGR